MKKLEDFQGEKVEVKSIFGGYVAEPTLTIIRDTDGEQCGQGDGDDA